jgi:Predicted membrane protein
MSAADNSNMAGGSESSAADARMSALEREVAALRLEMERLRASVRSAGARTEEHGAAMLAPGYVAPAIASVLRHAPEGDAQPAAGGAPLHGRPSFSERLHSDAAISGDELESMVGRYGTLSLAALLVLMGVGAIIKMAVEKGLLTPEVRVVAGLVVAVLLAGAGIVFRRRGEVRYGGVLLALSLAVVDLVAWGAGPRFHLVPVAAAMAVVDVVALALAALALKDDSEFLFAVSVAGALSAPFVTSDGGGTALTLLLYGGVVLAGALRAVRHPHWSRAFAVLVTGALVYSLAAAALPISTQWYGPYLVALFGAGCAAAALLFGEPEWKSELPRAYVGVSVIGVMVAWDAVAGRPRLLGLAVSFAVAVVTYAGLLVRQPRSRHWTASALLLPFVSVGIAYASAGEGPSEGAVLALWTVFALIAWRIERSAADEHRAGAHLLAGGLLGSVAITAWLWGTPLGFVAGLAAWGAILAGLARHGSLHCRSRGSAWHSAQLRCLLWTSSPAGPLTRTRRS